MMIGLSSLGIVVLTNHLPQRLQITLLFNGHPPYATIKSSRSA